MTTTMPAWLLAKLDNEGILDAATRLTRRPRPRRCTAGCGLYILGALDDLGIRTYLELWPTTNAGELFALLTGRATYALDHGELYQRNAWNIAGRPAANEKTYVAHVCHGPPLPANPKFMPVPRPAITDEPPF
jgi:hypothetical protein